MLFFNLLWCRSGMYFSIFLICNAFYFIDFKNIEKQSTTIRSIIFLNQRFSFFPFAFKISRIFLTSPHMVMKTFTNMAVTWNNSELIQNFLYYFLVIGAQRKFYSWICKNITLSVLLETTAETSHIRGPVMLFWSPNQSQLSCLTCVETDYANR